MMEILRQLFIRLGVNGVPLGGFIFGGWSWQTAVALYWVENFIGIPLIAAQILIHQQLTHKRGHYRTQLGVTINGKAKTFDSFLSEFLISGTLFVFVHGIFLLAIFVIIVRAFPDLNELRTGLIAIIAFQVFDFASDLISIRQRPFTWIKTIAGVEFGRIVLFQLAIMGGMFIAALANDPTWFFLPFALLKLFAEVGGVLGRLIRVDPSQPAPSWLVRVMNRVRPNEDFATYWKTEDAKEAKQIAEDEQVMPGMKI